MRRGIFKMKNKGVSLTEVLVVLVIVGVASAMVHTVFITNFSAFNQRIAKADLWQEGNRIVSRISEDVRGSNGFELNISETLKSLVVLDGLGAPFVTYNLSDAGQMDRVTTDGIVEVLSSSLNFDNSDLIDVDTQSALRMELLLRRPIFTGPVDVVVTSEVYPRN